MKRNYGIDLLRMILMYMVVVLHVLGHGGVLNGSVVMSRQYYTAYFLEGLALCAVNGYGIITGYVYYGKKINLSSLIQLWIQAVVYSLGIAICVWILRPQYFTLGMLLNQSLPVYRQAYWYLSSYVGLFLLIPFLNQLLQSASERQAARFVAISFLVISLIPTALGGDPFNLQSGYSTAWLMYLYIIGACIRKFEWGKGISQGKWIGCYLLCAVLTWTVKLVMDMLTVHFFGERRDDLNPYAYTCPTVVLSAVALLLVFRDMKLPRKLQAIVAAFSPAAFGVYLIHEQTYFREYFICDRFTALTKLHPVGLAGAALAIALCIFVFCISVDYVRYMIFLRLGIKHRLDKLERCFLKCFQNKTRRNPHD